MKINRGELDRHITGNYGEDQFSNDDEKERGLYRKFRVTRVHDPEEKHKDCFYFVLDLDHDPHALPAIRAYIESCEEEYPVLAADLTQMIYREEQE